jgi:hypothetical protein
VFERGSGGGKQSGAAGELQVSPFGFFAHERF